MFITVAMTVAAFNILKAKDESGREIEPVHEFTPGLIRYSRSILLPFQLLLNHMVIDPSNVSHPKPFQCTITPRSERAKVLIRSVVDDHPFEKGDGEILKNLS